MMRIYSLVLLTLLAAASLMAADKPVSDDAIYDRVRIKLANDREVGRTNIEVSVEEGVVGLRGTVRQEKLRDKAERIARRVKGVKQVVNELKVEAREDAR
ncbi:MAG: BON domain-containing protein [Bryobacteraceae bacterium]